MSIPIPVGTKHLATASGQRWKAVRCAHCKLEWAYLVERKGRGSGSAPLFIGAEEAKQQASEEAQSSLVRALDTAVEPVRCPGCRRYQPVMVELLKDQSAALFMLAAVLAVVGALVLAYNFRLEEAGGVGVLAVAIFVAGRIRRARFTPPELAVPGEPAAQTLLRGDWETSRASEGNAFVPKIWWQDLDEAPDTE